MSSKATASRMSRGHHYSSPKSLDLIGFFFVASLALAFSAAFSAFLSFHSSNSSVAAGMTCSTEILHLESEFRHRSSFLLPTHLFLISCLGCIRLVSVSFLTLVALFGMTLGRFLLSRLSSSPTLSLTQKHRGSVCVSVHECVCES